MQWRRRRGSKKEPLAVVMPKQRERAKVSK